jgi:hypothetical protein
MTRSKGGRVETLEHLLRIGVLLQGDRDMLQPLQPLPDREGIVLDLFKEEVKVVSDMETTLTSGSDPPKMMLSNSRAPWLPSLSLVRPLRVGCSSTLSSWPAIELSGFRSVWRSAATSSTSVAISGAVAT